MDCSKACCTTCLAKVPGQDRSKPWSDCSREEQLLILHTKDESLHREGVWKHGVKWLNKTSIPDPSVQPPVTPTMTRQDFRDICKKSISVYVTNNFYRRPHSMVLHNYIYRSWLRPYRSEIAYQRFICKLIGLHGVPLLDPSFTRSIISLNRSTCELVESLRSEYDKVTAANPESCADDRDIVYDPICFTDYSSMEEGTTLSRANTMKVPLLG